MIGRSVQAASRARGWLEVCTRCGLVDHQLAVEMQDADVICLEGRDKKEAQGLNRPTLEALFFILAEFLEMPPPMCCH